MIMIKLTLPDNSVREYEAGVLAMDVAKSISEGLARNGVELYTTEKQLD